MKTVRMSVALAGMAWAALLVLAVPVSQAATWDNFYSNASKPLPSSSTQQVASAASPGQGFDIYNTGSGARIERFEQQAYMGTSLGSEASHGWDVYQMGGGDRVP